MSELNKLLEGVKVKWMALSDVAEIGTGSRNTNEAKLDGKYPFFVRSQIPRLIDEYEFNETAIITAGDGVGVGKVFHYIEGKYALHQRAYRIVSKYKSLDSKYLFHYIKNNFAEYIEKVSVHASVTSLRKPMFEKFSIPIPCPENPEQSLKIQKEIVRILDALTEETNALNNELTKELQAHQKQYEYHSKKLLNNNKNNLQWVILDSIGKFTYGLAAAAEDYGDTRFVRITDINSDGKLIVENPKYINLSKENEKYLLTKNDLLMARTGATFGKTMIFEEGYTAIYAGFLIKLSFNETLIPKYYWHFAQSQLFWDQANKLVTGGGQPQFNANSLKKIEIPIPFPNDPKKSLSEQERIVKILDELDIATQAIAAEIKKEIALRNKQYAYYRDLLLNFQKEEA